MNGEVGVESQPGNGSRFWLQFQAAEFQAAESHKAESEDLS